LRTISTIAIFLLVANVAAAQNRVTELQARSYIQSAFITGVAPAILSNDVGLGSRLRERLALPANADRDRIYESIFALTEDRTLHVRKSSGDEAVGIAAQAGGRPVFALEGGAAPLLVVYDLERNAIAYMALPGAHPAAAVGGSVTVPAEAKATRVAQPEPALFRLKPIVFRFDDAALADDAKAELEGLPKMVELHGVRYVVRGHADRLGIEAYNQRLSDQRALAVRDYLVQRGVPPQSIDAQGVGATMSQTSCEEKTERALIECLAPDRRVTVAIQPAM
jgi:outer membrane protein OmpA-like peptidoglycan-associated protein